MNIYRLIEEYHSERNATRFEIRRRYEKPNFFLPFMKQYFWELIDSWDNQEEALKEFNRITTSPSYTKVIAEKEARKL